MLLALPVMLQVHNVVVVIIIIITIAVVVTVLHLGVPDVEPGRLDQGQGVILIRRGRRGTHLRRTPFAVGTGSDGGNGQGRRHRAGSQPRAEVGASSTL